MTANPPTRAISLGCVQSHPDVHHAVSGFPPSPLRAVLQAVGALVQVLNASSVPGKEGAAVALRHLSCGRAGATLKAVKASKEEKDAQVRRNPWLVNGQHNRSRLLCISPDRIPKTIGLWLPLVGGAFVTADIVTCSQRRNAWHAAVRLQPCS